MAVETFTAIVSQQMAAAIDRQIKAVREIPGFATAKALVVCENNSYMVAQEVQGWLNTIHYTANMDFLHLTPLVRMTSGGPAIIQSTGEFNPGLVMRPAVKTEIMFDMAKMLEEGRIHIHSKLVTYASKDEDFRTTAALAVHHTTGTIDPRQLEEGVEKARYNRIRSQIFKQFMQMMRVQHTRVNRLHESIITYSFGGKKGKDAETGLQNKDDIVMAIGNLIYGAKQVYKQPVFQVDYGMYSGGTL